MECLWARTWSWLILPVSLSRQNRDFLKAPDVIGKSSFHRWRNAQSLMNSAKVVIQEVKGDRIGVIVQLL
jgi:hypothetical protein